MTTLQGQASGVKGFTYQYDNEKMFGFHAGIKENSNAWFKHYTSPAAFEAADSKFGSNASFGGNPVRVQSPNSGSGNTEKNELFAVHQIPDGGTSGSSQNPGGNTRDLTWDGQYLWHANGGGTLYRVDFSSGTVQSKFNVSHSLNAVTWDGQYLLAGGDFNNIYQYDVSGNTITSFNTGISTQGLTWDGSYLWVASTSQRADEIYRMKTDGTTVDNFNIVGEERGITTDGVYLYIPEKNSGTVYRVTKDGSVQDSFSAPGPDSRGAAWDGTYLYNASRTSSTYRITGSSSLDMSYQFATLSTGQTFTRTLSETVYLSDTLSNRLSATSLTGIVYKSGTPVQDAYVFAVNKETQNLGAVDTTNASGEYELPSLATNYVWLVGTDYHDGSTYYGDEKSITLDDSV